MEKVRASKPAEARATMDERDAWVTRVAWPDQRPDVDESNRPKGGTQWW